MLAVTTYEWFKTVHVLAVVMWVGGGVLLTLLALMTIALRDPVRLAQFARQAAFLGGTYFPPLSLMVVGFGFALVEKAAGGTTRPGSRSASAAGRPRSSSAPAFSGRRRSACRSCSTTARPRTRAFRR